MIKAPAIAFVALSLIRACGGDAEATVEVPQAPTFALTASHGGSVLFADNGWVEVVPKSDGAIEAYVVDVAGAPLPAPMTATVSVKVHGDDGATHDVVLPWNPISARFEGRLVEARPAPGPVEVAVMLPGRPQWRASAPAVVVVAAPLPPVAAPSVVVVESPRPRAVIEAPQPTVVVEAPRPTVVIEAPRPTVVVEGRHRGRHDHHDHGVVVVAPHPPSFVIAPPHPGVIVVQPGGHHGHGHPGRGHGRGHGGGRGRRHGRH